VSRNGVRTITLARLKVAARTVVAAALVALAACRDHRPAVAAWEEGAGHRSRALDVADGSSTHHGAEAGFTELSASRTAIRHRNDVADAAAMANRNLLIGAGAALGDIDGDGYPDLFVASVARPGVLYKNDGGLRFTDVTAASGLRTDSLHSLGTTFADVDGDADLDLLIGTLGGPIALWLNDGRGHFTDATATSGLTGGYAATGLTLADVDHDGDLDLYVATYKVRNALDAYPPQARAFDQVVTRGPMGFRVRPEWEKEFRIEDRPDLGGIMRSQRADPDLFFEGDGKGGFTRRQISGGRWQGADGRPLQSEPDYFTLAARFYDVNGDGNVDLYVCNDFEDPDQFWMGDGRGTFRLAPSWALGATSNTCMSVDFGDVDRDGNVDLFTADMLSPTLAERQSRIPTHTPMPKMVGRAGQPAQWMRNALQLSRGDGSFAEVAAFAGVSATDWTWGSAFLDIDLDGFEDLIAVNGHRWDIRDADTFDRIRNSFPRVPWDKEQGEFPESRSRSAAFRNEGDLTFHAMPDGWGIGERPAFSQGLALADLDLDGDLDAVVTRLNAAPAVMRNDATAPRIAVRLVGDGANRGGVGARVTVEAPSLPVQSRQVTAGGMYLSGSDATLTFATGGDSAVRVMVRWPDGKESVIEHARTNREYEIMESGSGVPADAFTTRPAIEPLFADATAMLGGHRHHEIGFDDSKRQGLLPNRFSQLGPGLAWTDADGDGRDDLVVGAGRGGRLTLLRNTVRGYTATPLGPAASGDLTGILPVRDARGALRILAGQSNYEAGTFDSALAAPRVVAVSPVAAAAGRAGAGGSVETLLAGDTASVGPLAAGDINGDGILDLLVGARVIPASWPLPAPSRLLLGAANGEYRADAANAAALSRIGLVSSAVIVDLDGDGDQDLAVATEFGPVRVLLNARGVLTDATAAMGLDGIRSRWNGLTVGDFDGDGRADLVATSWGRNTGWGATPDRPHLLFAGRFGGSSFGLVFARADSATGREMPLESFARLGVAFPGLRQRVPTYSAFSRLSVNELFGDDVRDAVVIGATTYDHTLFLNRGERFEAVALPARAQLAPAFGVNVADFDGDGREDLFLAQNFFPTEIETMRFDAGVGLVLLGDGAGGFRPLGVKESGIAVRGDQRGSAVADFDGDARPDLAVSQNGEATTLWRNVGARPGVRVRLAGSGSTGTGTNGTRTNGSGIGAKLWTETGDGVKGPARWILGGSGYWSADASTQVLATPEGAATIAVRWPDGRLSRERLVPGMRDVTVTPP
jgi:hypothetical protein